MNKIRLNADDLEVLSFTTAPLPDVRGTVEAAGTGNPCYVTVAVVQTRCMAYPQSYWGEDTCYCPIQPYTQDLQCQPRLSDGGTCITCPPEPGC
jgi:hypothetical protein